LRGPGLLVRPRGAPVSKPGAPPPPPVSSRSAMLPRLC